MPKKSNSKEIIIKAATDVFANVGFAGARVDEIALHAGVNKATIYYNIGNKELLYSEVLKSIFKTPIDGIENKLSQIDTPEEKLKLYIHQVAKTIDENPGFPKILLWEHASGGKNLPPDIVEIIGRMLNALISILDEGHAKGVFRKPTPLLTQFMIISTMIFYKTSESIRNNHTNIPEIAKNTPENLSGEIAKELEKLILNSIKIQED